VVFNEESMLQEKSKTEDKAQGGASDSSTNTQEKKVEFLDNPKRPDESEEDSSDSYRNEQKATQKQPRPLRQSIRVTVPPAWYGWKDDHDSLAFVTETGDPSSYREAIEANNHSKWITAMEHEMESLNRNQHEH